MTFLSSSFISFFVLFVISHVHAITIYTVKPGATPTEFMTGVNGALYTGLPAFDPSEQTAPAVPQPPIATAIPLALSQGGMPGLGKKQSGNYMGLSIELSVAERILGHNGTLLNPIFLNHISNLNARSGKVSIRIGGNTQDHSTLVPALFPNIGPTISKTPSLTADTTPIVTFTADLLYTMANISALLNVEWYLGLPFLNEEQISNVADTASAILGPHLAGFQLANEPDLYLGHSRKTAPYAVADYITDWKRVRDAYVPGRTDLIAPSVCCSWPIDEVLAAGFLDQFASSLKFVAVQHYYENACPNNPTPISPDDAFPLYLNHTAAIAFTTPYLNASAAVAAVGKDLVMFETNTASCGGFGGVSDSFGAALYFLDVGLQTAYRGFSQVLLHTGGIGQYYNPMTPPPTNQTTFRQWTTTPIYYSALIMAEAMGPSGAAQVVDLALNGGNIYTPGYAIYENDNPAKVALFNFITDPTGASDVTVSLSIGGGATGQSATTPSQVQVRYFYGATTAQKFNLTYAGQTMGDQFASDGRLQGTLQTETVQCTGGICNIALKAPSFALVFLTPEALQAASPPQATQTFATTVTTKLGGTAIIAPEVLETSFGRGGAQEALNEGSTSLDQDASALNEGARRVWAGGVISVIAAIAAGSLLLLK